MNKSIKFFREIEDNRKNKGFSMAEMLIVVALIILTLSIAIPNVLSYKRNMELMHADDVAREIFLSAQNELVYQKSTGQLTDIYNYIMSSSSECVPANEHSDGQLSLYYIKSGSAAMDLLLGGKKLNAVTAGGYYYIEVEPSSANVYSVFYTEKDITWDELNATANGLRNKEGRRKYYSQAVVGYYAAKLEDLEYAEAEHIKLGNLSIINSEELYVEFDVYVRDDVLSNDTKLTLTLLDEQEHSQVDTISLSTPANEDGLCVEKGQSEFFDENGVSKRFQKYTVRKLIDSMEDAYRFKSRFSEFSLGSMITAAVSFKYEGVSEGKNVKEEISDSAVSNSSFAQVIIDSRGFNSVGIRYIRHLYNIQDYASKASYIQVATLDFEADNYSWSEGKYFNNTNEATKDSALNPLKGGGDVFSKYHGVTLPKESEYLGNGNRGNTIKNFKSDRGIFSKADSCELSEIYVVNHKVKTTADVTTAGGLIGKVKGGSIRNCRVYQENGESFIDASAGSSAGLCVGGLAGKVKGAITIEQSCAAIPVVSASAGYCGGLVGFAKESAFSKCYGNTTDLKGKYAGGFAGSLSNCNVRYCYAVAEAYSNDTKNAAGFCADMNGGSLRESYALIGSIKTSKTPTERIALIQDNSGTTVDKCYFNYDGKFEATQKEKGESAAYNEIVEKLSSEDVWEYDYNDNGSIKSLEFSKPFHTEDDYEYMENAAYTCLRIKGMPHYGNWPDASCTIEYLPNLESIGPAEEVSYGDGVKDKLEGFHSRKILTSGSIADSGLRDYVWEGNYPEKTEFGKKVKYVFKCWKVSGTDKVYYPGDPIEVSGNSLVLMAQWVPGITITYDTNANDKAKFFGEKSYDDPHLRYEGEEVEILFTDNNNRQPIHNQGYQFIGWNDKDGKNNHPPKFTYVLDGNESDWGKTHMEVKEDGTHTITLYAYWENPPKESHLTIRVNDELSHYEDLGLTLRGGIPVEYAQKPGDYFVNAKTGQYDLLLRGNETGIQVIVDSSGARFVQSGKTLQLLDLYTLKVKYRLNGTYQNWINFQNTDRLKSLFTLDHIDIDGESFSLEDIGNDWVYESPVMLPGSEFAIYVNEPVEINEAAKICKGTTPNAENIATKSIYLPSSGNVVKGPVTVYADYCSIEFKSPNEWPVQTLPPTVIVRGGSNYRCPTDELVSSRKGIFLGWSSLGDGEAGRISVLPGGYIYIEDNKELILYARWKDSIQVTYETNFYKNGHDDIEGCNIEDIINKVEGDAFYKAEARDGWNYASTHLVYNNQDARIHTVLPTKLQRAGYYFVGWGTSPYSYDGGTTYWPGSQVALEDDLVLYAQWAYDKNYTIVYLMSEEEFSSGVSNTTFPETNSVVTLALNRYSRAGKEFTGWHGYRNGSASQNNPNFRENFDAGVECAGGELERLIKCKETNSNLIILYGSWKDLEEKDSYQVEFKLEKMKASQNTSLYAYAGQNYTAVFECEGGYRPPDTISVLVKGMELDPKSDYNWNPTTRKVTIYADAIRGPVTIIGAAIPEKHSFSYLNVKENGDTEILYKEDVQYNTYNAIKSIEEIGAEEHVPAGCLFTGWNTKKDGSGTMYKPGDSIFIQGEVNLYACWKKSDVVGAGIYNGYLFYYGISANKHYYLARGETQTIEDGETLAVINDGGQVHFTKSNNQYTYYYCIMLQKEKALSEYTIGISRDDGTSYVNVDQKDLLSLDTNSSDSLKNAFGDDRNSVFEYGDSAYDYYYFKDTVNGIPEITNIKITEAEENGKSAIFDFANSLRPTNSQSSESINGSLDCFGNKKKYPKVDVYNGSVPRIDRSYANFFKNKDCRSEFCVHLDANNKKYKYNSINLVDENGISVTTRNNLIKATDGQEYIFNPDAMAELRSGTYTVIFDYSDYQNDPSFELHVYDEDLMGYRYIQMEIESLMAYCPGAGSSESSTWYYAQFADVAFYGDDKRISQYKFEDASCVYLDSNGGWSSSNKYEDISMIIDNNPRTKMCSRQIGSRMETESWIKLVIDVGDGYQFSPNIYGYTGLITAGDGGNYPWRMPNTFGFYGTNDSLNKTDINWELIDNQTLYDAKLESATNKDYIKPREDTWLNNVPFYTLADGNGENEMSGEWTKKLQTWLRQYLPYNVVDTPPRGDGQPLGYDMQPTPPHRIRSYSLTYNTNAPEGANITWYDPKNPTDPTSGNPNLQGEYGDQIIGFCIPQWKDSNGKTVKYFLGWSKDKNAREADYTSGSHINLITDTTLYAVWSEISPTFALTYHANDSESAPAVNMPVNTSGSGKCKISPLIPEREGYKFIGWIWLGDVDNDHTVQDDPFKEDNLGLYQPSDSILLNQNVTLYARWVKSKCVTVIAPGCKITSPGWTMGSNGYKYYVPVRSSCSFTYSIEEGVEFESISVMNKKGDSFTNFTNSEENGTYSCTIPKVTEDLTVNIKVQMKKFNVQVTDVDSIILQDTKEVIDGENKVVSFEVSYGETAAFYFKASGSVSVRGTTGAIVTKEYYDNDEYYLCRIPKVYDNLNLSVVEGICVVLKSSADATYSITVYIPKGENSILPTADMVGFLAPEGQRFAGWRSSGNEEIVYPGGVEFDATSLADGTTLYPHWAAEDTCTITIDYGYDIEPGSKTVKKGSWVVLEIPEREDWLFDGWIERKNNIDEPVSSSGFVAESDMIVRAQWKEACIVRFDGNGGKPFVDYLKVAKGSPIGELPQAVWDGWFFLGWSDSNGTEVHETTIIESDVVFNAEWTDAVRYHLNPDQPEEFVWDNTPANEDYQTLTYASISDGYTRGDARFIGWTNSADLRASNVKYYREGDAVSDGTTDLYAVWLSGTLYFERQCQANHIFDNGLEPGDLAAWGANKLYYRISVDLSDEQQFVRQIGSSITDGVNNTSSIQGNISYGDWWNSVVIPDTVTGGYRNWEVKIDIPVHDKPNYSPKYYPNTNGGKSDMTPSGDQLWTIDSSGLGSDKNFASYGIRDDSPVTVIILFGKTEKGTYLYEQHIPFGKWINESGSPDKNENIVIFPNLNP
ncbi:MAG: InlB B-repeat-containing protein [Eubacteriales bacterium]|nr:InlB B-repeat-containing protein [Eubacteriales bacterium]